jgi:hypothetical protein
MEKGHSVKTRKQPGFKRGAAGYLQMVSSAAIVTDASCCVVQAPTTTAERNRGRNSAKSCMELLLTGRTCLPLCQGIAINLQQ